MIELGPDMFEVLAQATYGPYQVGLGWVWACVSKVRLGLSMWQPSLTRPMKHPKFLGLMKQLNLLSIILHKNSKGGCKRSMERVKNNIQIYRLQYGSSSNDQFDGTLNYQLNWSYKL